MKITDKSMCICKLTIGLLSVLIGLFWLFNTYLLPNAFRLLGFMRLGYTVSETNALVIENTYSCSIGAMLLFAGIAALSSYRSYGATLCAGLQFLFIPFHVLCVMQNEENAKVIREGAIFSQNSLMLGAATIFGLAMILFYILSVRAKAAESAVPVQAAE